ncbi:MAG: hypothetical protein J4452_02390 [Candidatus Aenigmarchaeota archaeon]|nr:hypothetical protein [Candidatus Aenigmarchaeota archaeon]
MPLFGKKKEEPVNVSQMKPVEQKEPEEKPSEAVELLKMNLQRSQMPQQKQELPMPQMTVKIPEPVEEEPEEKKEPAQSAPLFIKLDRYKSILHQMSEIKMTMLTVKNTLSVINEMDKLKADSMKMIQDAVARVEKKLVALDTEFLKPSGFHEMIPQQMARGDIHNELDALKGQIEALRYEMEETA